MSPTADRARTAPAGPGAGVARRTMMGAGILLVALAAAGCPKQREMADRVEMPDTMPVVRAMHDPAARDSMLDTIPGGEMARGDSAAAMTLLKKKM